jgi:hypothetical protein
VAVTVAFNLRVKNSGSYLSPLKRVIDQIPEFDFYLNFSSYFVMRQRGEKGLKTGFGVPKNLADEEECDYSSFHPTK